MIENGYTPCRHNIPQNIPIPLNVLLQSQIVSYIRGSPNNLRFDRNLTLNDFSCDIYTEANDRLLSFLSEKSRKKKE